MKTCPVCQRPYSDEAIEVCPADGTELLNISRRLDLDATWRLTPSPREHRSNKKKVEETKPIDPIRRLK